MKNQTWDFSTFSFSLANSFNGTPNVTIIGNNPNQKRRIIQELLARVSDIPEPPLIFSGTDLVRDSSPDADYPFITKDYLINQIDLCHKYCKYHEVRKIKMVNGKQSPIMLCEERCSSGEEQTGKEPDPRKIVILDECFHDDHWFRDKWVRRFYTMGRAWMLMSIITLNRPLAIKSSAYRVNMTYFFILCDPTVNCDYKKRLWDNYASVSISSYETFDTLYNDLAKTNAILVIDQKEKINYVYEICA
jgi:hypothetical protein